MIITAPKVESELVIEVVGMAMQEARAIHAALPDNLKPSFTHMWDMVSKYLQEQDAELMDIIRKTA